MSCGLALTIALMMTDPNVATAAAVAAPAADAPVSVAGEPLFVDIVTRSSALKSIVDGWSASGAADAQGFLTGDVYSDFKTRAEALAATDMQAHLVLKERGTDGDLKCILRGISQDLPKKLDELMKAANPAAQEVALRDMAYLLVDNVEVITAPPQPEA